MIAVDWGTTYLRAYRLGPSGAILARRSEPRGIMAVRNGEFAAALDSVLDQWDDDANEPILMSGMIGSRQGWREVPYVACPAGLRQLAAAVVRAPSAARPAFICPGLSCRDGDGVPDVMRGEEVQIFGALEAISPLHSASICLPGTHSKHAIVRDRAITGFLTYMTGEIFALFRDHSILGRLMEERRSDLAAFDDGLRRARQSSGLLHHVFGVRTRVLMGEMDAPSLADYLSGILIGHELAAAPLQPPVLVVGEPGLCALYRRAFAADGIEAATISADVATARGLHALAGLLAEERA